MGAQVAAQMLLARPLCVLSSPPNLGMIPIRPVEMWQRN